MSITLNEITRIYHEITELRSTEAGIQSCTPNMIDVSDHWHDSINSLNKTFKCQYCNAEFGVDDVETNESYNKYWCLECDELIFDIS
jgi:hypothetical protein